MREEVTFIYHKLRECLKPKARRGILLRPSFPESPPPQRPKRRRSQTI